MTLGKQQEDSVEFMDGSVSDFEKYLADWIKTIDGLSPRERMAHVGQWVVFCRRPRDNLRG